MAGSGVSGGTAMLRTRRRDVSIKPNRRLDRKSSRGMIYENEELRLRTININAEVEQGQNDIKKLRRENEQLRREIWSLRDEYDKLEELVKNQSCHGSSDELEGRSAGEEENLDDVYTEYSGDDDVVDEEEEEEEGEEEEEDEEVEEGDEELGEDGTADDCKSQEEDLENVENQKISSEKMNSSMHRLHVEFDDLSVVDEEEELQKKDKEKKDSVLSSEDLINPDDKIHSNQGQTNDINYHPSFFDISAFNEKYFNDSPFVFPNPSDPNYPKMLPIDSSNIYNGQLTPLPCLDTPGIGTIDPIFGQNEFEQIPTPLNFRDNFNPTIPSLPQRRNVNFDSKKKPVNFSNDYSNFYKNHSSNIIDTPNSSEAVNHNGWDFSCRTLNSADCEKTVSSNDKPKHFFAPLPAKFKAQKSVEEVFTATSSSSDKTNSTVVSRNHYHQLMGKGTADVYVNGGFPISAVYNNSDDNKEAFLSSENLLVEDFKNVSRQSSNNPLIKSLSCHDLSSDPQTLPFSEKLKLFNTAGGNCAITKSDNTLDNINSPNSANSTSRPFKSQLNVTLKLAKPKIPSSPNTPEIPKLPVINYRLFNNPFLQSYNENKEKAGFNIEYPMTRPLSIQVNEDPRTTPVVINNKNINFKSRIEDPCLLLMAANQYRNLEELNNSRRPNLGFEMTSFEGPSPQTLLPAQVNPILQNQVLYQAVNNNNNNNVNNNNNNNNNNAQLIFSQNLNTVNKVPAQTQTSIDGDSQIEDKKNQSKDGGQGSSLASSPLTLRRKRTLRKERSGSIKDKRPLSPAAQRRKDRLRKQSSVTSSNVEQTNVGVTTTAESPTKTPQRSRKFSVTTSTSNGDIQEKNESRSSSSGQDSPKKIEQRRRVSLYFNAKKRPSIISTSKIDNRRSSIDNMKDRRYSSVRSDPHDATTTNSERERTNSVSSRETVTKGRKMSTGSGKVPWCACWGNGCV